MQSTRPLPWYPGPKLHPFRFRNTSEIKIEFGTFLGSGLHSTVHRVNIDGSVYALKVFRFFHPSDLVSQSWINEGYLDLNRAGFECDPFNAECRAYGRLKETAREDLAAKCFGYILLSPDQELKLAKLVGNSNEWHRRDAHKGQPLRCIVKEYIEQDSVPFDFQMISRMRQDIQDINKLGIIVFDLREGNYLGGRLVDFSQAHTTPHYALDLQSTWISNSSVRDLCARDLICFDSMMDEWNTEHPKQRFWPRFLPNKAFGIRLRNHSRYFEEWGDREGARLDAALYDWKKGRSSKLDADDSKNSRPQPSAKQKSKQPAGIKKPSKRKRKLKA